MTNSFLLTGTSEEDKAFADEPIEILVRETANAANSTPSFWRSQNLRICLALLTTDHSSPTTGAP